VSIVTELCATPTAPVTCGLEGYGYGTYLISAQSGIESVACHKLCLTTAGCKSFQTLAGGQQTCNLFNAATAGNMQPAPGAGFTFYDRDCTDLLPAGCTAPPSKAKRNAPIPTYLATVPATRISSACSCFITSALPVTTKTIITLQTGSTTNTVCLLINYPGYCD